MTRRGGTSHLGRDFLLLLGVPTVRLLLMLLVFVLVLGGVAWHLRVPSFPVPPRSEFVLPDVTVVQPGEGRRPHVDVVVRDGRVEVIGAGAAGRHGAPALEEARGAVVLPGLVDAHAHLPPAFMRGHRRLFALLWLAHGVTAVRETGSLVGADGDAQALAAAVEAGEAPGPRFFGCGAILDGPSPEWPTARAVQGPEEALRVADAFLDAGAVCVKVYPGVDAGTRDALRARAAARGVPLVGHLPARRAFDAPGVDEIQHVCDPHCWSFGPAARRALVAVSRERGIAHTPTLVVFERHPPLARPIPADAPRWQEARWLPPFWSRVLWDPLHGIAGEAVPPARRPGWDRARTRWVAEVRRAVADLHAAGLPILAGSDTPNLWVIPGSALLREVRLLAEAGLGPAEALRAATSRAGAVLPVDGLGRVRPGAPADLLVLAGDPTRDLALLERPLLVVADGRVYRPAALRRELERLRRRFHRPLYRAASNAAARLLVRAVRGTPGR